MIAARADDAAINGMTAAAAAAEPARPVSRAMNPRLSSVRCVYSS
jgi:hypothetical protein